MTYTSSLPVQRSRPARSEPRRATVSCAPSAPLRAPVPRSVLQVAPRRPEKQLRIRSSRRGQYTLVRITGELDVYTADMARDTLLDLLTQSCARLVLDLSRMTFCGACGISTLLAASRTAEQGGGWVRLAGVRPQLRQMLDITRLTKTLATYRSVAAAVADTTRSAACAAG